MKHFKKLCALCILTSALLTFSAPSFAVDLIVPDTGQTLCYDLTDIMTCPSPGQDLYGQDGNYLINPPSLTDKLDGTVTDNLTGLIWEQKTVANEKLKYTIVQQSITAKTSSWEDVMTGDCLHERSIQQFLILAGQVQLLIQRTFPITPPQ